MKISNERRWGNDIFCGDLGKDKDKGKGKGNGRGLTPMDTDRGTDQVRS
jgi:hypothetical protein